MSGKKEVHLVIKVFEHHIIKTQEEKILEQGEYCLNLLLKDPESTLIKVADGQQKSETYIFNKICDFVESLNEEDKIILLDQMYLSNKFKIFFDAAKNLLQGKDQKELKKKLGIGKTYLKNYDLLIQSSLLKKSLDILYFSWNLDLQENSLQRSKYLTTKKIKYCLTRSYV